MSRKSDIVEELRSAERKSISLHEQNTSTFSKAQYEIDFQTFFQTISDGCYLISENGTILDLNPSAITLIGKEKNDVIGTSISQWFLSLSDQNDISKTSKQLLQTTNGEIPVILSISDIKDKNGTFFYSIIIQKNISSMHKTDDQIQEEWMKLQTMFDGMAEIIYVSDMDSYQILYMNSAGKNTFGNYQGKPCYAVIHNQSSPCSFCTNTRIRKNPNEPYIWEYHNKVSNRWYRLIDKAIEWDDNHFVRFSIAIDLTKEKSIQKELEIKIDELQRWKKIIIDRERKMIELKKQINMLKHQIPTEEKEGNVT